ncbi:MAG TPA: DUF5054 domain-containing protein [Terriglobales bacterium]|nr:DUF5054 domain-containing protein [Terriglobales bacterium]
MQRRDFIKSVLGSALVLKNPALFGQQIPAAPAPDPGVKRVLVMFKCHFDAGFVDTQAAVVNKYFKTYFPLAMDLASQLRDSGDRRYVWTTGSWLLYEYLEQATPTERTRMEKAIGMGDIAWHAIPFSWQTELLDRSMIAGSIGLSHTLDKRFGQKTTGAKMSDVPGHTRGLIAPLAAEGVKFLDIGVNEASSLPEVPSLFAWKSPSGASLVVMYHHGYGGVVPVPGSDMAVAIVVRDDNAGPHTLEEVNQTYASLNLQFPNAKIIPTSLTEIANAVEPHQASLPVLTGEIGDTWIHGVASDPLKLARYREVARLRQMWVEQGKFAMGDVTDIALLRRLLLEVEHTWGTDTKTWLDFDHYKPSDLTPMLDTKNYKVVQFSWQEKRDDLFAGIATLPSPLREQAQTAVDKLKPAVPRMTTGKSRSAADDIETAYFVVGLDPKTGAIRRLLNKKTKREWASSENPLAVFSYQTLSQKDYDIFFKNYVVSTEDWAFKDFGKPNIERFGAASREWIATLADLQVEESQQGHRLISRLEINDSDALRSGRASFPQKIFMEILFPTGEPTVHLNFSYFEKPATRLPEALWLSFRPITSDPAGWTLEKTDESVSPMDIVKSGNRHMHAVSKGFGYKDRSGTLFVETLDAPVVTLGTKSPLPFSNAQPDLSAGVHCNLFNNAWGTNYIMWSGDDMNYRFILRA